MKIRTHVKFGRLVNAQRWNHKVCVLQTSKLLDKLFTIALGSLSRQNMKGFYI